MVSSRRTTTATSGREPAAPVDPHRRHDAGLVKVAVDYAKGGCHVEWRNTTARIPTVVSKLSRRTGLIYGYTHPSASELPDDRAGPRGTRSRRWFFTAFSARTGKQVWSRYTGSGLGYNNNYAPVSLGPDGTAYVGTLGGLLRIADSGSCCWSQNTAPLRR